MDDFRVGIWIWDGVEELDFAGPYEVLTSWARMAADERTISVRLVSANTDPITCSHGLRVIPDVGLSDLGPVDLFLHPGGQVGPLLDDDEFQSGLRARASDTLMTSVCNGALVYAKAGLLTGRPAATHWSAVTSAGVSAGIDMALHLVRRLHDEEMARRVRHYIQYEPAPPV